MLAGIDFDVAENEPFTIWQICQHFGKLQAVPEEGEREAARDHRGEGPRDRAAEVAGESGCFAVHFRHRAGQRRIEDYVQIMFKDAQAVIALRDARIKELSGRSATPARNC